MRFRTGALIGSGGAGDVYKAFDPDLGRSVALKMLRRDDPASAERFQREARSQAALAHPNVCEVYETGELDGQPYIAMRWVDGVPIDEHCRGRPIEEKVRLVADVAGALQTAHAAGLVHRDLKPSNLLVEETDEGPRAFVLDFGIARHLETGGPTQTGEVLGTAGYMSPEQARGEQTELDRRSDVFSLGCVLYELLAGRPAFVGLNPMETLLATLEAEPVRLRKLAPSTPRDLEVVVHRALDKDRDRRYPSARALQEDLEAWLAGEPIRARPPGPAQRLVRWSRRHRALATGLIVAAVTALIGGAVAWRERALAAERAEVARRYGQEAEAVEATLRVAHLAPRHDTAPLRRRIADRLDEIRTEIPSLAAVARGPAYLTLAAGRLALGQNRAALRAGEAAVEAGLDSSAATWVRARALAGLYREGLADTRRIEEGAVREAAIRELEERYRNPAMELVDSGHLPQLHRTTLLEAEVALLGGDLDRARELAGQALEEQPWRYEAELLAGETEMARADAARSRGETSRVFEALDEAEAAYRRAVAIGRSAPKAHRALCDAVAHRVDLRFFTSGELSPDEVAAVDASCAAAVAVDSTTTAPHEGWSYAHVVQARWQNEISGGDPFPSIARAEAIARDALALEPGSPVAHRRLGEALLFRSEFERQRSRGTPQETVRAALEHLQEALELAPDDPVTSNVLGLAFWELVVQTEDRGEDPLEPIERAIEAFSGAVERVPDDAKARTNLATLIKMRGQHEIDHGRSPVPWLRRAITELEAVIETDPTYSIAYNNLGDTHVKLAAALREDGRDPSDEIDRALQRLEQAADRNPDWAFPWYNRALAFEELAAWKQDRGEDPTPERQRAVDAWEEGLERRSNLPGVWMLLAETRSRLAEGLAERGRAAEARAARARAERAAEEALGLDPSHEEAAEFLAEIRERTRGTG